MAIFAVRPLYPLRLSPVLWIRLNFFPDQIIPDPTLKPGYGKKDGPIRAAPLLSSQQLWRPFKAVLWIRISVNTGPDPVFYVNTDPDPCSRP